MLAIRFAPPSPRIDQKINVPGQTSVAVCLAAITDAVNELGRGGWAAAPLVALLVVALLALLFVWVARRSVAPMFPRRLRRSRVLATTALCGAVINMTFYGTVFALSIY